jgi:hypothetical protein
MKLNQLFIYLSLRYYTNRPNKFITTERGADVLCVRIPVDCLLANFSKDEVPQKTKFLGLFYSSRIHTGCLTNPISTHSET